MVSHPSFLSVKEARSGKKVCLDGVDLGGTVAMLKIRVSERLDIPVCEQSKKSETYAEISHWVLRPGLHRQRTAASLGLIYEAQVTIYWDYWVSPQKVNPFCSK